MERKGSHDVSGRKKVFTILSEKAKERPSRAYFLQKSPSEPKQVGTAKEFNF